MEIAFATSAARLPMDVNHVIVGSNPTGATMKEPKIRYLEELFEEQLYRRLPYANQKFNLGITERRATMRYNDVPFEVTEASVADMLTGEYISRIWIEVPKNIMKEGGIQVSWRRGDTLTEAVDLRRKACHQLAHLFVHEVLPKVDFELEKQVYAYNVDRILSVLD